MFKYVALLFDVFLAVCYISSSVLPQLKQSQMHPNQSKYQYEAINIIVCMIVAIPPILHILTFICTPHCYVGHCQPTFYFKLIKEVSTDPSKQAQTHKQAQQTQAQAKQNSNGNDNAQQGQQKVTQLQAFKNIGDIGGIKQYLSPHKYDSDSIKQELSPFPRPFELTQQKQQNNNSNKNNAADNDSLQQLYQCKQCKLTKWIRMQHCYNCKICVHKYDHHCILLGICIGESNQKYYLPFLWVFLVSSVVQTVHYYGRVGLYLYLDEKGYQHMQIQYISMSFAIIFFVASIVVVGYLAAYHTWLAVHNQTTYEMKKRNEIKYLQGVYLTNPFDKGCQQNIKLILTANNKKPIEWERPKRANYNIFQLSSIQNQSQQIGNAKNNRSNSDILNDFDKAIQSGKKISKNTSINMIQMQNLSNIKKQYGK